MNAQESKAKWRKDMDDSRREAELDEQRLDRCPHIRTIQGGDESMDMCDLVDKWCLIQHGQYECEIRDEIKEEKDEG